MGILWFEIHYYADEGNGIRRKKRSAASTSNNLNV